MEKETLTVAYLIDSLSFGGAERQLSLLAPALPAPFKPVVISLSTDLHPFGAVLESKGIEVVAIERRSHADLRRLWEAARVIRLRKTDIVHGFLDAANAYAFAAACVLRKPVVLSLQNQVLRMSGAKGAALLWMLRRADCVLVNSRAGADFLRARVGVPEKRILHIPNWIDPNRIGRARDIPPPGAPVTIGFVGRFARQKRVDLLVDTFHRVLGKMPDSRLILMGDGNEREQIKRRVERLNIADSVEFIPADPNIDATLRRIHVFVMTSAFEGLPNAAIEALSMGIPIVSTPVGDIGELIVEGKTGTFFEDDRPDSMAETLARVLTDRSLLENAARLGPRLVEEKFSLRRGVERLTAVYRTLAAR
jgi:glycosyltransferase involved in cell wall biosynthesis